MKKIGLVLKISVGIFAFLGLLTVLLIAVVIRLSTETPTIPEKTVILLDLAGGYPEKPKKDILSFSEADDFSFFELTRALERIKTDDRVKGVFVKADDNALSPAQMEEIRKQIVGIKKTKKKTYAFASSYPSLMRYYLATGAETVAIQPMGEVAITGIRMEVPFFKNLLTKIGVKPVFEARHEYKSGPAEWTQTGFSKEQKQNLNKILKDMMDHVVENIKKERPTFDKGMIDIAPLTAEEAMSLGLVDSFAYELPMKNAVEKELDAEFMAMEDYIVATKEQDVKKKVKDEIAIVVASGMILSGTADESEEIDAVLDQAVVETFRDVFKNENVKAVVFRIDSPGGGFQPSDVIYEGLKNLKTKGVPLFISMGDTAASGGYYISLPADMVFADELTITGSIGVYGGKFVVSELLSKLGITVDKFHIGKNAGMLSNTSDFSENERKIFAKMMDAVYKAFTGRVTEHRKVKIDAVARGRIFSGKEALENGLVDGNASLQEVIAYAAEVRNLKEYRVVKYPKSKESLGEALKKIRKLARRPIAPPRLEASVKLFRKLENQEMRLWMPALEIK